MAEATDQGHDIESELVIGQGEMGFGLRPVGLKETGTMGMGAASDGQRQPEDAIESRDGAEVIVTGPEPVLTFRAIERDGDQAQSAIGLRRRSSSLAHGGLL
jgi:hypothetical protein